MPAAPERVRFDFSGTRVLVTGGSNGIGLGVATGFAGAGAEVTITGRSAKASDYESDLGAFRYEQAEMLDRASVERLATRFDEIDVLVNNAGGNFMAQDEWQPDVFDRSVRLNLLSAFQLATLSRLPPPSRRLCASSGLHATASRKPENRFRCTACSKTSGCHSSRAMKFPPALLTSTSSRSRPATSRSSDAFSSISACT